MAGRCPCCGTLLKCGSGALTLGVTKVGGGLGVANLAGPWHGVLTWLVAFLVGTVMLGGAWTLAVAVGRRGLSAAVPRLCAETFFRDKYGLTIRFAGFILYLAHSSRMYKSMLW